MAQNDGQVVVLVDAYTSGRYLPPEFRALGAELLHVQSTPEPRSVSSVGKGWARQINRKIHLIVDRHPVHRRARRR